MENFITRQEHDEFSKRQDAENDRQNRRIQLLENNVRQINELTVSVKEMAVNMSNMLKELEKQGERLEALEKEPAETTKQIKQAIITAIVGTIVGAVVTAVIMIL
ncbi:MAG: coiled-coil domain-containing protein 22 [Hespellia sp.]|jgi:hypothetical protein|nr:coiled-coil domain-containing protein 22 [Hespellia sp.]